MILLVLSDWLQTHARRSIAMICTGGHAFAESYEQHQKNVSRLRLLEAEHKEQPPADLQSTASQSPASAPSAPSSQRRRRN